MKYQVDVCTVAECLGLFVFLLVPGEFHDVLQRYTMQGYRVLGLAWKPLDPKLSWHQLQRVTR